MREICKFKNFQFFIVKRTIKYKYDLLNTFVSRKLKCMPWFINGYFVVCSTTHLLFLPTRILRRILKNKCENMVDRGGPGAMPELVWKHRGKQTQKTSDRTVGIRVDI
jgi:hypothetical protein